ESSRRPNALDRAAAPVLQDSPPREGSLPQPQGWGSSMLKRRSQVLCAWFLVWDLVATAAAWVGAYWLRFDAGWLPVHKTPPAFGQCLRHVPLVLLLCAIAYRLTGQYAVHRLRRLREETVCVVKGTVLLSLVVMATLFFLHDAYESRATLLL